MDFIKKILDIKLVNNDILITNNILSYIKDYSICEECKKFNECKKSYQQKKNGINYQERKLCLKCFIEITYNGKNRILKERDFFKFCKHNYID